MALVADMPISFGGSIASPFRSNSSFAEETECRFTERELEYLLMPLFRKAEDDLKRMRTLSPNWDTYGAEPPTTDTIAHALELLMHLQHKVFAPTRVVPSSEGGVAVFFTRGDRYADIEFLNTGEVLAVTYTGKAEPDVWEITGEPLEPQIERISRHLTA